MSQPKRTLRFSALDGWRGLCALLVAAGHFSIPTHLYAWPLIRHSYLFVDFFFVLSGFVIAHAYGEEIRSPRGLRIFMTRRLGRLWPLHMVILLGLVSLELLKWVAIHSGYDANHEPFAGGQLPVAILTQALFMNAFGLHDVITWNAPSWSIGAEFYTYLLFALCCLFAKGRIVGPAILLGVIGAGLTMRYSTYIGVSYECGIFRCVYGFFCGVVVYRAVRRRLDADPSRPSIAWAEWLSLAVVIAMVTLAGRTSASYAAPLVFAGAVYVFAFESGSVSRALRGPIFQKLGLWSFSIYMIHMPVLVLISLIGNVAEKKTGLPASSVFSPEKAADIDVWILDAVGIGFLATVIGLSSITYRLIEQPGQRWFNRLVPTSGNDGRTSASISRAADPEVRLPQEGQ